MPVVFAWPPPIVMSPAAEPPLLELLLGFFLFVFKICCSFDVAAFCRASRGSLESMNSTVAKKF